MFDGENSLTFLYKLIGFILPSHIFRVLLRLKIFEIGELGMLMYGRNTYADDSGMSFGNYVSAVENDVNNRKKEIEENLRPDNLEEFLK